jgi:hypothetical protein
VVFAAYCSHVKQLLKREMPGGPPGFFVFCSVQHEPLARARCLDAFNAIAPAPADDQGFCSKEMVRPRRRRNGSVNSDARRAALVLSGRIGVVFSLTRV